MTQYFRIASITDEFAPDIETAIRSMSEIGMTGAELRMISGKNIMDLTDAEIETVKQQCASRNQEIISIASPLLKCTLPNAPDVDARFQQDMFAAKYTLEDQDRLAERAFEIAKSTGAKIIRVFSFWRTVDPSAVFDRVVEALAKLADKAAKHDLIIGLENEHACNIATGAETGKVLAVLDHPNLKIVWDPANAYVSGEQAFPDGYRAMPINRIAHVHAKDCVVTDHKPTWGPLGEMGVIDWKAQIQALVNDGYQGWISLETHWPGPGGNKHEASMICGRNLIKLVAKP